MVSIALAWFYNLSFLFTDIIIKMKHIERFHGVILLEASGANFFVIDITCRNVSDIVTTHRSHRGHNS